MTGSEPRLMVPLKRLRFRRQFLLGPQRYAPNEYWTGLSLPRGLELSVHRDLPVHVGSHHGVTATLIGLAVDPGNPGTPEADIARLLAERARDLDSVIHLTLPLAGRWVVIFQTTAGTRLFTDPCGLRQVFYHSDGEIGWCASQPELIRANHPLRLTEDQSLLSFVTHRSHVGSESQWVGRKTIYENCFHLMPNHYLDLDGMAQVRFYPSAPTPRRETHEAVESAAAILRGIMTALSDRYQTTVAITAGWDSRVLLAASRHVSRRMVYYVNRRADFAENNPDVMVAARMAKELGLDFSVKNRGRDVPGWFVRILADNVTCARVLPKTSVIYDKLVRGETRINVNGNAGVFRDHFHGGEEVDGAGGSSPSDLAARMFAGETVPGFVVRELEEWEAGLDLRACGPMGRLGYLYWEQRMGNWGAQFPAEQDVAVDEFSPFNCRLLIETLLSVPIRLREAHNPALYRELVRHMWPAALEVPVNPRLNRAAPGDGRSRRRWGSVPSRIARGAMRTVRR